MGSLILPRVSMLAEHCPGTVAWAGCVLNSAPPTLGHQPTVPAHMRARLSCLGSKSLQISSQKKKKIISLFNSNKTKKNLVSSPPPLLFIANLWCHSPYSQICTTWFRPPISEVQNPTSLEWAVRRWNSFAVRSKYSRICMQAILTYVRLISK